MSPLQILELSRDLPGTWDYRVNETSAIAAAVFNITPSEGIVYVTEREKLSQIVPRTTLHVTATSASTEVSVTFVISVTMHQLWSRNRLDPETCGTYEGERAPETWSRHI